jgi:predicted RNA-binding protein associated with RNAse of E/G family
MPRVEIQYRRPPDRLDVFVQDLVVDRPEYKVTLHDPSTLTTAISIAGRTVYEPGAPIVWYLFPSAWFDLGRFHLRDGTLTGYYVNFIAPPDLKDDIWTLYDLCLDLWVDTCGDFQVLDQDEFDEAVDRRWIDPLTAARVREELHRLIAEIGAGRWPPNPVAEYDLRRTRALRSLTEGR